jgi:hypothetical protein
MPGQHPTVTITGPPGGSSGVRRGASQSPSAELIGGDRRGAVAQSDERTERLPALAASSVGDSPHMLAP